MRKFGVAGHRIKIMRIRIHMDDADHYPHPEGKNRRKFVQKSGPIFMTLW